MLKLKLQYSGYLMQKADSLEKTLMLGEIEGKRRKGWQDEMVGWCHRLRGHESELTRGEWRTGEPGMLQCLGLQRVGHDLATEQQQIQTHTHTHTHTSQIITMSTLNSHNISQQSQEKNKSVYLSHKIFFKKLNKIKSLLIGTSLVVQWLRICLPMQGIQVRSLVGEQRSHVLQGN